MTGLPSHNDYKYFFEWYMFGYIFTVSHAESLWIKESLAVCIFVSVCMRVCVCARACVRVFVFMKLIIYTLCIRDATDFPDYVTCEGILPRMPG